jgi:hypothetical protein
LDTKRVIYFKGAGNGFTIFMRGFLSSALLGFYYAKNKEVVYAINGIFGIE